MAVGGNTPLPSGNYLVISRVIGTGAVTFGNGTTGVSGEISAANSLLAPGSGGITVLTNGNYVVSSPFWLDGSGRRVGATTFGNGATGITGFVSPSNSLLGSEANDQLDGKVTALSNGNYVVANPKWGEVFPNRDAGAVTFGSGTGGVSGVISASNSLIGSTSLDNVGRVTPLTNGNYVVSSTNWKNSSGDVVGAVTFGNGTSGISGEVSETNSLVGSDRLAPVGNIGIDNGGVIALPNGNYVISSDLWSSDTVSSVGAVTFSVGT